MKIFIEKNTDTGYRVRAVDRNKERPVEEVIDFRPYTLTEAFMMAEKVLEIYNRKHGTAITHKEAFVLDEESVLSNRDTDSLSRRTAEKLEKSRPSGTEGSGHDSPVERTGKEGVLLQAQGGWRDIPHEGGRAVCTRDKKTGGISQD